MILQRELDLFNAALPDLLADPSSAGMFALVSVDGVAGVYDTFDAALAAGYDRFGLDRFLVKHIVEHEEPRYFSRNLVHKNRN